MVATEHPGRRRLVLLVAIGFGVLAGRPAFDPERLPIGPYTLPTNPKRW